MRTYAVLLMLGLFGACTKTPIDTATDDTDTTTSGVDDDGDGYDVTVDCDDSDPDIHPDAPESCDGLDNDCDQSVDEDGVDGPTWYVDADHDGYGDPSGTVAGPCSAPSGYAATADDCNDADAKFHPGADESDCSDPNDYNCDGSSGFADGDADGFAACQECDDGDAAVHPGADELCNGEDDNCDGAIDDASSVDAGTWYADKDGDGYGDDGTATKACKAPSGYVAKGGDCDDADGKFNPGAAESDCNDPNDYNCDGSTLFVDVDGDGEGACVDCDDADASVNTSATELCNGVDDNCDGATDEATAADATRWYVDADGDGYGDSGDPGTVSCTAPSGTVSVGGDCNDADTAFHPGAAETSCSDPSDYNCDGSTGYTDKDGDGYPACEDCDDSSKTVSPGASETCDGVDDDCDGTIDESSAVDAPTWYADGDGDGYGTSATTTVACSAPSGYVALGTDCDDTSKAVSPAATETCNSVDDDCDGTVDDSAIDATAWYADKDGDGYGATKTKTMACSAPSGYIADGTDCDDTSSKISPAATEMCDAVDNDCDGTVDESSAADASTWYADGDGDGYGDSSKTTKSCSMPSGYASVGGDCDDKSKSISPGATEYCNGADDDCDGTTDEDSAADAKDYYADTDADGYGAASSSKHTCYLPTGYSTKSTDCDDTKSSVYPGAIEYCDGYDDNCDGTVDEATAKDASTWYKDADSDGYGTSKTSTKACSAPSGYVASSTDCNDAKSAVNPGATEYCNGYDDNCDGKTDDSTSADASTYYADADGDGYGNASSTTKGCSLPTGYTTDATDCDDTRAATHPTAYEYCNGKDDDCNGTVDDAAADAVTYYYDADGDGYGTSTVSVDACSAPTGYVSKGGDCDDTSTSLHPGATEYCNGVDDNCDGQIDDSSAVDAVTYYADKDGDGFGNASSSKAACSKPTGYVTDSTDCDDTHSKAYPGATEYCDGYDDNCDGSVDESTAADASTYYKDADGDGYGLASTTTKGCSKPSGYASVSGDCDDSKSTVSPAASEVCDDGVDGNCDSDDNGCEWDGNYSMASSTSYDRDMYGTSTSEYSGWSVSGGKDFNKDGYSDVIVGAPYYTNGSYYYQGRVYVVYGSITSAKAALSSADVSIKDSNTYSYAYMGSAVAALGDLDKDGYADFAMGAYGETVSGYSYAGAAYIFSGASATGSITTSTATAKINGTTSSCYVGWSMDDGGDFNKDGYSDVIVGGYYNYNSTLGYYGAGGAGVFTGPLSGTYSFNSTSAKFFVQGNSSYMYAGQAVAGGGDLNGDGYSDVIVGAPYNYWYTGTGSPSYGYGTANIFLGPKSGAVTTATSSADAYVTAASTYDYMGSAVAIVGDENGDGYDDYVAVAPYANSSYGAAYLFTGASKVTGQIQYSAAVATFKSGSSSGFSSYTYQNHEVSSAGDVDKDGKKDILIGLPYYSSKYASYSGAAWLFYGSVSGTYTLDSTTLGYGVGAQWYGAFSSGYLGRSVSSAGDTNKDGFSDILAGEYYGNYSTSSSHEGNTYLMLGGSL